MLTEYKQAIQKNEQGIKVSSEKYDVDSMVRRWYDEILVWWDVSMNPKRERV